MTTPPPTPAPPTVASQRDGGPATPRPGQRLSVWPTAQQQAASQRAGRYLPASTAHPAKMLPAIARHAITTYTQAGELVLDPMCGIGTTLVEAVSLGRDAVGVELEARWVEVARGNLALARRQGAAGHATVHPGDARALPELLPAGLRGRVAMVLTSPPYGSSRHGQVRARAGAGVAKWDDTYSATRSNPTNLAHANHQQLLDGLTRILASCRQLLRPGGLVVLTVRPWRRREELIDFPGAVASLAEHAGLVLIERNVALLCGLREGSLVPRPSFFQLDWVRKHRRRGVPLRLIAHEDVLVFRNPD